MGLISLINGRGEILYTGHWEEKQVQIIKSDLYLPEITEEMKKIAAKRFADRKEKNPKLFDGPARHLAISRSVIARNHVVLAISEMTYSIYDIAREELAKKYGWKKEDLPTGMGTVVAIRTSDEKFVMHSRVSGVDHVAKIGAIGGVYSGKEPFADILEEIWQELAIEKKEVTTLFLDGIYARKDERMNHGLAFFAETSLSSEEILEREKTLTEKEGKIFFLDAKKEIIRKYLEENHSNIISDSFIGLVLASRYLWGRD